MSDIPAMSTQEADSEELLRAEARRKEVEYLSTRGMDLLDEQVMAGAWRRKGKTLNDQPGPKGRQSPAQG